MKTITVGVGVIVVRAGRIALGLRKSVHPTWSLPGGKVEPFEHILDCAARELREETGLIADGPSAVLCVANISTGIGGLHTVTFGVVVDRCQGELTTSEPDKFAMWEWFNHDKLPANLFWPTYIILQQWDKLGRPSASGFCIGIALWDE